MSHIYFFYYITLIICTLKFNVRNFIVNRTKIH